MKVGEQSQAAIIWDEETGVYIFFTASTSADELCCSHGSRALASLLMSTRHI